MLSPGAKHLRRFCPDHATVHRDNVKEHAIEGAAARKLDGHGDVVLEANQRPKWNRRPGNVGVIGNDLASCARFNAKQGQHEDVGVAWNRTIGDFSESQFRFHASPRRSDMKQATVLSLLLLWLASAACARKSNNKILIDKNSLALFYTAQAILSGDIDNPPAGELIDKLAHEAAAARTAAATTNEEQIAKLYEDAAESFALFKRSLTAKAGSDSRQISADLWSKAANRLRQAQEFLQASRGIKIKERIYFDPPLRSPIPNRPKPFSR